MGSSLLLSAQPQPQIRLLKTMKVLLLLAGLLLCLHLSEGFSYRGNVMRNRNLGSGGRQRMGGMGFGKRAYDFYNPEEEQQDYYDELDEAELERLEEAAKILDMEEKAAGEVGSEAEKRGISSLKGKRAFGMALSSLRSRGRGKRGALSSLRNQGFVKYNI